MPRVSNTVDQARTLLERRLRELDDERRRSRPRSPGSARAPGAGPGRPRGRTSRAAPPRRHQGRPGGEAHQRQPRDHGLRARQEDEAQPPELPVPGAAGPGEGGPDQAQAARATTPAAEAPTGSRSARGRFTASRSSLSSATVASIRSREKSVISRPSTTLPLAAGALAGRAGDQALVDAVGAVGGDAPSRPSRRRGCPRTQSCTWSIAALAAEAALEAPRASMIAAPRLPTVGMNSSAIQASSSTCGQAGLAVDQGVDQVRVLGRRVVAPDGHPLDVGDRALELVGELGDRAVVVEPHHRGEPLARDVGGVRLRDQAVGVGRVADHQHLDVVGGAAR